LRESLAAVDRNAFSFSSEYVWLYAIVPIQLWVLLALILTAPLAVVVALFDRAAGMGRGLWRYAALLGAAGVFSALFQAGNAAERRLAQVGVHGWPVDVLLFALIAAGTVAGAGVFAAAAAWYEPRSTAPLRRMAAASLALCLAGMVPAGRFLAREASPTPTVAKGAPRPGAPNVLIVSIDTLRADALGSYGNPSGLTPNLDAFAAGGVRFDQAFSSSSWTLPAIASLFTGLNARNHGAGWVTDPRDPLARAPLPGDLWTITAMLRREGYETAAVVTNPYLALRYGFGAEFDRYVNLTIAGEIYAAFEETSLVRFATWMAPALGPGDRGRQVSAAAARWLEARPRDRPFYLWVHYIDPHAPYCPGQGMRLNSFRGDSLLASDGTVPCGDMPDIARLRSGEARPDAAQKRAIRALYDGEVAEVDAAVGSLLQAVDRMNLTDSTLIVMLSDHGEEFWEHGGVEHGHTVYDEVVRIPLLVRWPKRLPAGAAIDGPVRIADVAPTIGDLLDLPVPAGIDGMSLLPAMESGRAPANGVALMENMHFAEERVGLRTDAHKYVRWAIGKEEAYDLRADPGERVDLAGVPSVVEPLRRTLDRIVAEKPARPSSTSVRPDPATAEALRALGYVD
jgi:arylsulfatase A-like enzyme